MLHTNFDIDVICFQLGNGQFQLLMQFCNLFYIRTTTTTYFLRLLLFSKTSNFPQLTIEKGMLYVQYTSHTGQHKQLGLNKSQGCLKNPNEKHLARILFDQNKKRLLKKEGFLPSPLFVCFCSNIKVQISVFQLYIQEPLRKVQNQFEFFGRLVIMAGLKFSFKEQIQVQEVRRFDFCRFEKFMVQYFQI